MKRMTNLEMVIAVIALLVLSVTLPAPGQTTAPASQPSAFIEGRVVAPDGKPIVGARVGVYDEYTLAGSPLLASGQTDSQGRFQVALTKPGRVTVAVQADGYGLSLSRAVVDADDDPLEILLRPPTSVKLRVVDSNGVSAGGIRVAPRFFRDAILGTVHAVPEQIQSQIVQSSDAVGYCVFPGMPRETEFTFEVFDEKFTRTGVIVRATDSPLAEATEPFKMAMGGILEGRLLLGATGKPAANVRISDRNSSSETMTDADGKFRLVHLIPGDHTIYLRMGLEYPLNKDYVEPKWEPIHLAAGQVINNYTIKLVTGTAIRGRAIVEGSGQPVSGINISIGVRIPAGGSTNAGIARSEADGSYVIRVLPGAYRVVDASSPDRSIVSAAPVDREFFTIEEGKDVIKDVVVRPSPSAARYGVAPVKGTVVDEQGNPVQGARVTLSYGTDYHMQDGRGQMGGPAGIAPSMGDGSRTVTDAAGRFQLLIAGNGDLLRVRKGNLALPQPVTIGPDRDLKLTLSGNTAGSAVVHIVGDNNQPLPDVTVGIRVSNGVEELATRWGTTKPDGTFTLSPVYGDRNYRVFVGGGHYTSGNGTFTAIAGKQVDVPPIRIYKADSFITGLVINEQGEPLANIQVMISSGQSGSRSVTSNAEGRFRVEKLVAGDTIMVRTIGATINDAIQVPAGTENAVIMYVPRPTSAPSRGAIPARSGRGRGAATRGAGN